MEMLLVFPPNRFPVLLLFVVVGGFFFNQPGHGTQVIIFLPFLSPDAHTCALIRGGFLSKNLWASVARMWLL